ncbi:LysR family transcriptional regulator [Corynebacterium sp. HMSC074E01]|uniref:LysR family transcriptional regulator n=1 Tax=Corynebacterium sp. HMSC074E01 TaxID=1715017 RepID=UPI0008A27A50|nr:LysR family transcriptional regulator [Corynebacterium sp. HMSC074E01]OFN76689.1 LysR family transcriptional regulator [Corynebacterium sp. HMSC074E01]
MLDLHRLRILYELHRLGTVTAVAESLRHTHSAISQQLAQCEKDVGVALYEKVGRRVRLTEQGEILASYAERMLALADEAESQVIASTNAVRGTIKVTTFQTIMSSLVPRALTELAREYPDLRVQIIQREADGAMELLARREVDLILGEEYESDMPATDEHTHRELLLDDPLRLITPLTGPLSELRLEDFAAHDEEIPFAMDPEEFLLGRFVHRLCRRHGFNPSVLYETPDPFLHAHLVRTGHAVAVISDLFLDEIEGVRVVSLPGNPTRTLYTAVRAGREGHPALRAFREALGKAAATAKDFGPLPAV